jgi:hypothetical protein
VLSVPTATTQPRASSFLLLTDALLEISVPLVTRSSVAAISSERVDVAMEMDVGLATNYLLL